MKSKNVLSNCKGCVGDDALFGLGVIGGTPGAFDLLHRTGTNPAILLGNHQRGDFGIVSSEDASANMTAVIHGTRILSSYAIGEERLWIITEADRSSTIMLLPDEY